MLPEGSDQALADFVFVIAIPLLVFRTVALADFSGGSPWLLWIAYYIAFAVVWVGGTVTARRLFGRDARAGVVSGVSAAYANSLLLGIPLIIAAYGNEGAAALSLLIAINLPIMMAVSAILIEHALVVDGLSATAHTGQVLATVARTILKNPIIIGIVVGVVWRVANLPYGGPVGIVASRLADVAATLALFSIGMTLRKYGISGNVWPALIIAVLKLAVMPAIVFALVATVFPLPAIWAKSLVIAAACPTGVNAWAVAARFRTGQALASNAITITTAAAVVTVALWLQIVEWL
jgi:predicted permease